MKTAIITTLSGTALLAAAAFLCGYSTLRLPPRRKEGKTHVACVGDSITYGCAVPLFFRRRYPAVLQRLLGPEMQAAVFAVNDRTMQSTGNKPFRRERAFRQSLDYRPDTVVLLLGTNDAKACNWRSEEAFRRQYAELIAEYRSLPSKPRILLCVPPAAFAPFHGRLFFQNDGMLRRLPAVIQAVKTVAADEGLEWIDLYALTKDRPALIGPDGLHPTAKGARVIAGAVVDAIRDSARKGAEPDGPKPDA